MKKRDNKWWNKLDYKSSLDYYLASLLDKYSFNPLEVVVWYYNKKTREMIFQSNYKYYRLKNNIIKEISEKEVWHIKK